MGNKLTLGIFGFGVVGQGLYDIFQTKPFDIEIKKFVIKDPDKKRTLPAAYFSTDPDSILDDPNINTVVELINDGDAAYEIVVKALKSGKNVVTANKKMLAEHLEEFVSLQRETGCSLLYEGAVCGSIPIIRNLEEYYNHELLHSVSGIFNGSSNYILSKIFQEGLPYAQALKQAQELGFAETDPILDVGGFDPKFKLVIAALHAYGLYVKPDDVLNIGIDQLQEADIRYAQEKNYKIKLIPTARATENGQVVLYVLPHFVKAEHILSQVENENNGVVVRAAFADEQFFYGKGAGGHPTGSAVLSDIAALRYNYRYEYQKYGAQSRWVYETDVDLKVYVRYTEEALIEKLGFKEVHERYSSGEVKYVTGILNLSDMIRHKEKWSAYRTQIIVLPQ